MSLFSLLSHFPHGPAADRGSSVSLSVASVVARVGHPKTRNKAGTTSPPSTSSMPRRLAGTWYAALGHLSGGRRRRELDIGLLGRRCHHVAARGRREAGLGGRSDPVADAVTQPAPGSVSGMGWRCCRTGPVVEDRREEQAGAQERLVRVARPIVSWAWPGPGPRCCPPRRRRTGCRPVPATGWSGSGARRYWRGWRGVVQEAAQVGRLGRQQVVDGVEGGGPDVSSVCRPVFCSASTWTSAAVLARS